ncbi:MAG: hypothetical protein COY69_02965 [Candidatus Magasanikbacteria bacterium CG_4_10_14_0_8_um_filter_32_14]|uniref:ATP-dependent DNA helicase RecQ n=1 Tax=Candidatus Magasanikbacteria bacterium CG_4_10_14_0_8_um_filter_32_14 TaxID=1974640 RepID=A0A2M7R8S3_9BACT|nr:MAG: hypothetical protein COY69_02965 [Candidatus Magasanikbacteria bacterium CG_4_10_14_0_8_um_filter_32_14]
MLNTKLKQYFNFENFRPGQEEIVQAIISGQDVIALMPTGGGKSLCYQLPALAEQKITLVISPLIALMKDQVDSLKARDLNAVLINSTLNLDEIKNAIKEIETGESHIIYMAPEGLNNKLLKELLTKINLDIVAVDEAHCVSEWGHDFRPHYRLIKDFIASLKKRPTVTAFTATATPEVRDDIIKNLDLQNPQIFVRGFDRPNLRFFVRDNLKKNTRYQEILRLTGSMKGSGIIYAISRKETEKIADFLNKANITAVAYHAGLEKNARRQVQENFMENKFKVIVATIAFGMGVDKADIRFVIHAGLPSSMEGYYQEAGRAGRDGETAYCILLHSKADIGLRHFFLQKSKEEMKKQGKTFVEINKIANSQYEKLQTISSYAESNTCRRKTILNYFADPDVVNIPNTGCGACDICLNFQWEEAKSIKKEKTSSIFHSLSNTVLETVNMYKDGKTVEQIAKIRSLGVSTVFQHLIRWHIEDDGDLPIENFITKDEEKQILIAMSKAEDYTKLSPIKINLPDEISYEKIRLVMAKIQKVKLW